MQCTSAWQPGGQSYPWIAVTFYGSAQLAVFKSLAVFKNTHQKEVAITAHASGFSFMVWGEEVASTEPFNSRCSLEYFSLKQFWWQEALQYSYKILNLKQIRFEILEWLPQFPHTFCGWWLTASFVAEVLTLTFPLDCKQRLIRKYVIWKWLNLPITSANGSNCLKNALVWKVRPGDSIQLHVCPMCLLFFRICLERNNSFLRIFGWSGLLPMFAPTEYLMTFVATYSFFCVALMRETWIWCVFVTLIVNLLWTLNVVLIVWLYWWFFMCNRKKKAFFTVPS